MNILFVSSEALPFIKTGGLADVAYALPKELKNSNENVSIVIPLYKQIKEKFNIDVLKTFNVKLCWRNQQCSLYHTKFESLDYYFIGNDYYFNRESLYGYEDDAERFAFFSNAVLETLKHIEFKPDIIHCNDWHSGILIPMLKYHYSDNLLYKNIKTIYTIHNLRYQGVFPKSIIGDAIPFGNDIFTEDKLKYYDCVSFMKGGINFADIVTTVSKAYASEITTKEYGEGLDGVLLEKGNKLYGIVNGIDTKNLNPKTDTNIYFNFDSNDYEIKYKNKTSLQCYLGLKCDESIPMLGMITRLTEQKGIDLVCSIIDELVKLNVQLVVLGTGDSKYENVLKEYSRKYKDNISASILFDNSLAQKIYAASDMFLMPSEFEPCGIGQLIALRYGSIPIVRKTGGLKDTINNYYEDPSCATGFQFNNLNSAELMDSIVKALSVYNDKNEWYRLIKNAMSVDNSWSSSARSYINLYKAAMEL